MNIFVVFLMFIGLTVSPISERLRNIFKRNGNQGNNRQRNERTHRERGQQHHVEETNQHRLSSSGLTNSDPDLLHHEEERKIPRRTRSGRQIKPRPLLSSRLNRQYSSDSDLMQSISAELQINAELKQQQYQLQYHTKFMVEMQKIFGDQTNLASTEIVKAHDYLQQIFNNQPQFLKYQQTIQKGDLWHGNNRQLFEIMLLAKQKLFEATQLMRQKTDQQSLLPQKLAEKSQYFIQKINNIRRQISILRAQSVIRGNQVLRQRIKQTKENIQGESSSTLQRLQKLIGYDLRQQIWKLQLELPLKQDIQLTISNYRPHPQYYSNKATILKAVELSQIAMQKGLRMNLRKIKTIQLYNIMNGMDCQTLRVLFNHPTIDFEQIYAQAFKVKQQQLIAYIINGRQSGKSAQQMQKSLHSLLDHYMEFNAFTVKHQQLKDKSLYKYQKTNTFFKIISALSESNRKIKDTPGLDKPLLVQLSNIIKYIPSYNQMIMQSSPIGNFLKLVGQLTEKVKSHYQLQTSQQNIRISLILFDKLVQLHQNQLHQSDLIQSDHPQNQLQTSFEQQMVRYGLMGYFQGFYKVIKFKQNVAQSQIQIIKWQKQQKQAQQAKQQIIKIRDKLVQKYKQQKKDKINKLEERIKQFQKLIQNLQSGNIQQQKKLQRQSGQDTSIIIIDPDNKYDKLRLQGAKIKYQELVNTLKNMKQQLSQQFQVYDKQFLQQATQQMNLEQFQQFLLLISKAKKIQNKKPINLKDQVPADLKPLMDKLNSYQNLLGDSVENILQKIQNPRISKIELNQEQFYNRPEIQQFLRGLRGLQLMQRHSISSFDQQFQQAQTKAKQLCQNNNEQVKSKKSILKIDSVVGRQYITETSYTEQDISKYQQFKEKVELTQYNQEQLKQNYYSMKFSVKQMIKRNKQLEELLCNNQVYKIINQEVLTAYDTVLKILKQFNYSPNQINWVKMENIYNYIQKQIQNIKVQGIEQQFQRVIQPVINEIKSHPTYVMFSQFFKNDKNPYYQSQKQLNLKLKQLAQFAKKKQSILIINDILSLINKQKRQIGAGIQLANFQSQLKQIIASLIPDQSKVYLSLIAYTKYINLLYSNTQISPLVTNVVNKQIGLQTKAQLTQQQTIIKDARNQLYKSRIAHLYQTWINVLNTQQAAAMVQRCLSLSSTTSLPLLLQKSQKLSFILPAIGLLQVPIKLMEASKNYFSTKKNRKIFTKLDLQPVLKFLGTLEFDQRRYMCRLLGINTGQLIKQSMNLFSDNTKLFTQSQKQSLTLLRGDQHAGLEQDPSTIKQSQMEKSSSKKGPKPQPQLAKILKISRSQLFVSSIKNYLKKAKQNNWPAKNLFSQQIQQVIQSIKIPDITKQRVLRLHLCNYFFTHGYTDYYHLSGKTITNPEKIAFQTLMMQSIDLGFKQKPWKKGALKQNLDYFIQNALNSQKNPQKLLKLVVIPSQSQSLNFQILEMMAYTFRNRPAIEFFRQHRKNQQNMQLQSRHSLPPMQLSQNSNGPFQQRRARTVNTDRRGNQ